MSRSTINAELCAKMFLAGARNLEAHKEWINELNVFPVPDGDTGTNMTLTIMAAAKEVEALDDITMEVLAKAISSGSLRGARGNSGVILSQLLRGFTKEIKGTEEIDVPTITEAFQKAVKTAYKAVMKPKEGTILTVAKGFADKAKELAETEITMEELLGQSLAYAEEVLKKTPEMLPVLKEAGVVDSGGQGLIQVLKGAFDVFLGKEIDYTKEAPQTEEETIKFLYCVEFDLKFKREVSTEEEDKLRSILEGIGEEVVVLRTKDAFRIHLHTNDPGVALTKSLRYGQLVKVKIDNLREEKNEHKEILLTELEEMEKNREPEMPHKEVGFISVSVGDGVGEIFKGLGVDYLIEGGQTMNPSTEDMLNAIAHVNADTIFIFPNNSNIIMAANQAQDLTEDKRIIVIPTKTIPQGISAIVSYEAGKSVEENEENMKEAMSLVKSGQITYAVRDTHIDDKEIRQGNIMGIGDKTILAVGEEIGEVTKETIRLMVDEDAELISLYYGADVTEEDANALGEEIQELFPDCEVEVYAGGQPIYYYLISVE
ncbi:MAG: DAK2 domain-containing protein [Muricoprocola sp.]